MTVLIGVCAGPNGRFEAILEPGLDSFEPNVPRIVLRNQLSIARAYNEIIRQALATPDFTALVLLHDDIELLGPVTPAVTQALADPLVWIVGAIGGRSFFDARWWDTTHRFGRAPDPQSANDYGGGRHVVDAVDGLCLAMSRAACEQLCFDEKNYLGFHGYDVDICAQARAAGKQVVVTDLNLFHHAKAGFGNYSAFRSSEYSYVIKWKPTTSSRRLLWRIQRFRHRLADRYWPEIDLGIRPDGSRRGRRDLRRKVK